MNELVKIESNELNGELRQTVNARELHEVLEVKTLLHTWLPSRIIKFGFIEDVDFIVNTIKQLDKNGRPLKEYHITTDMAKQLCMVENNEKGKEARLYFIKCERMANQPKKQLTQIEMLIEMATIAHEQEKQTERNTSNIIQLQEAFENNKEVVKKQVKAALKEEQVGIFPTGCVDLDGIREKYFRGISQSNISLFLQYINHKRKEYKKIIKGNEINISLVYEEEGLAMAFKRLLDESSFVKETLKNIQYHHAVMGNFRVKKIR